MAPHFVRAQSAYKLVTRIYTLTHFITHTHTHTAKTHARTDTHTHARARARGQREREMPKQIPLLQ